MTPEMAQLMNGSMIPAVDTLLYSRMGNFWYIALFTMPVIMVFIKTQNTGLTMLTLFFSLVFYGYLMVGSVTAMQTIFGVILAVGVMVAIWKAFSPSN